MPALELLDDDELDELDELEEDELDELEEDELDELVDRPLLELLLELDGLPLFELEVLELELLEPEEAVGPLQPVARSAHRAACIKICAGLFIKTPNLNNAD